MNHSFNVEVATKYGVEEAILLENLYFWCKKNKANKTNFHDGYYWTYNSVKAFEELFPYMKRNKIYNSLKKLEESGLIKTGDYNSNKYDHTTWYAVTEEGYKLLESDYQKNVQSISENKKPISQNKKSNISNEEISITDINTDNKPDISIGDKHQEKSKKLPLVEREPDNDIERVEKEYLLNYQKLYQSGIVNNEKPVINWLQSRRLTKQVIEKYGVETIIKAVKESVNNSFCLEKGYCLTTILSSGVLAGLINGNSRKGNSVQKGGFDEVTDEMLDNLPF